MSRVISFRDLQRIPTLRTYSEDSMIRPDMDEIMFRYLAELGFSLDHPIEYIPSLHRDMAGNVAIGYQAVGEVIATSRAGEQQHPYLRHPVCPLIDRLMAVAKKDMSLAFELSRMAGQSVNVDEGAVEEDPTFPDEWIEPTFKENDAKIKNLLVRRNSVRKIRYNENGSVKTPKEILYENGRK